MDFSDEELCENVILWLDSLRAADVSGSLCAVSMSTVVAGRPLAEILTVIDPSFFNGEWLETIQVLDVDCNYHLKGSNLRRVYSKLRAFYETILDRPVPPRACPDVNLIAKYTDPSSAPPSLHTSLCSLLALVIGAALYGKRAESLVPTVMAMPEGVMQSVMVLVKKCGIAPISNGNSALSSPRIANSDLESSELIDTLRLRCDQLEKRCTELDTKVAVLTEEGRILSEENDSLLARLARESHNSNPSTSSDSRDFDSPDQPESNAIHSAVDQNADHNKMVSEHNDILSELRNRLQREVEDRQRAENENEQLHRQLDETRAVVSLMEAETSELSIMRERYESMKDECDELREKVDAARRAEVQLEVYRRKYEEQVELKAQLKILEDKNANYMRSVLDLEEERRKNNVLRTQLESNKKRLQQLENELGDAVKRADRAMFEANSMQDRLSSEQSDKLRLQNELKECRGMMQNMAFKNEVSSSLEHESRSLDMHNGGGDVESSSEAFDAQNSLAHRLSSALALEKSDEITRQLEKCGRERDQATMRSHELSTELALCQQKLASLEEELSFYRDAQSDKLQKDDNRLNDMHEKMEGLAVENEQLRHSLEACQKKLHDKEIETTELLEVKDRYRRSMEKARTVISNLESLNNERADGVPTLSRHEFDSLRKEVEAKDKSIDKITEDMERMRTMYEQEVRLITSAFHSQGLELNRYASRVRLADRSKSSETPTTFLAEQRAVAGAVPRSRQEDQLRLNVQLDIWIPGASSAK